MATTILNGYHFLSRTKTLSGAIFTDHGGIFQLSDKKFTDEVAELMHRADKVQEINQSDGDTFGFAIASVGLLDTPPKKMYMIYLNNEFHAMLILDEDMTGKIDPNTLSGK